MENRFQYRRSAVATHPDHEPHLAVQPILAHESLWLDSGDIPISLVGDMSYLAEDSESGYRINMDDDGIVFDPLGKVAVKSLKDGGTGVIRKRIRVPLTRGRYGEYACSRATIHENLGLHTAALYRPLLEGIGSSGDWRVVQDHEWELDYAAGVLTTRNDMASLRLHITFYEYVGRIGPTDAMRHPTTDMITEGAKNKFMARPQVERWTRDVVSQLTTDDIAQGDLNMYGENTTVTDNRTSFHGVTQGHHHGTVTGHVSGTVSSLANHKTIRAKIIGSGEGEWTGQMHGHVRGTFDGELAASGGEMHNITSIAIGGTSTNAPLSVFGDLHHIALISGNGRIAYISASDDGAIAADLLNVNTIRCDQLNAMGIDAGYGGMARVGDVAGVRHMSAESITCRTLCAPMGVLLYYDDTCSAKRCEVRNNGVLTGVLGRAETASSIRVPCATTPSKLTVHLHDSIDEHVVEMVNVEAICIADRSITSTHRMQCEVNV